jgi:hypothetical protein
VTDLATEEARAMSGRPAWRVAAACIKGVACPRCSAEKGVRCSGKVTCRERVWCQRAYERLVSTTSQAANGVFNAFLEAIAEHSSNVVIWQSNRTGEWRIMAGGPDISAGTLQQGITGGLIRLITWTGCGAWAITEGGAAYAEEWARVREAACASAQPTAPPVDADAATRAFMERAKT